MQSTTADSGTDRVDCPAEFFEAGQEIHPGHHPRRRTSNIRLTESSPATAGSGMAL